jgi:hypothetical protein
MELYHLKKYIDDLLHRAVAPVGPVGILKSNITLLAVPEFITEAFCPDCIVVVVPTLTVTGPAGPVGPLGPVGPQKQQLFL